MIDEIPVHPVRWKIRLTWLLAVCVLLVGIIHFGRRAAAEEYRTYTSPDDRFKVIVFRIPSLCAMPGQSGDAAGFVRLVDARTGRVLRERSVEMVQSIDQLQWSPDGVQIKLFADWPLPR